MKKQQNLHGTVVTAQATFASYGGEKECSRSTIQTLEINDSLHSVISGVSIRNAMREKLEGEKNRERINDGEKGPEVLYKSIPNPNKFPDDDLCGWLLLCASKEVKAEMEKENISIKKLSPIRVNCGISHSRYNNEALLHQSPHTIFVTKNGEKIENDKQASVLHQEALVTVMEYIFSINISDLNVHDNIYNLLRNGIINIGHVGGNSARYLYSFYPATILLCLTELSTPNYTQYAFSQKEVGIDKIKYLILNGDFDGKKFFIGGDYVYRMDEKERKSLADKGVSLFNLSEQAVEEVCKRIKEQEG